MLRKIVFALLVAGLCGSACFAGDDPGLPEDFKQILPRGRIPAVFEPEFVTAEEAEIDDEAWVLGVVIDGDARAYSLNLLNRHEVVNDHVGGAPIAAVW